jgi:Na+/H+-dicarboxylate symporter
MALRENGPIESAVPAKRWRFPFVAQILSAMALGICVGLARGVQAGPLGQLGTVLIELIKGFAAPLLFFAIIDALLRTKVGARSGLWMLAIALPNAALAVAIGLTYSNVLRPGDHFHYDVPLINRPAELIVKTEPIDFVKELTHYVPTSIAKPFLDNSIVTIVVLALLAGGALRRVKNEQMSRGETGYRSIEDIVATLYRALEVALGWIIRFIPLAVFGVVASTVGRHGLSHIVGLAAYLGVAILGLATQMLVVYQAWVVFGARMPLRRFWSGAREALVYALGSSSSLATLPVTLRCLERMRVSPQSARMAACVGTNLNNDGILLYEAMAVLFVAQAHGIHLTVGQQLLTAVSSVIAAIGIAGFPDAGFVSLSLILTTVGLPVEILPILLTVDWILSRCRAVTNVTSDILVAVLLDRFAPPLSAGQEPGREGPDAENLDFRGPQREILETG